MLVSLSRVKSVDGDHHFAVSKARTLPGGDLVSFPGALGGFLFNNNNNTDPQVTLM